MAGAQTTDGKKGAARPGPQIQQAERLDEAPKLFQTNGGAQVVDSAPEGERARGGRSECRGSPKAGSASVDDLSRFVAQSERERVRVRVRSRSRPAGEWRRPAACLQTVTG
ncbi:hypothetical protein J3F83DRAFT_747872 [Trichoderma novae-zelandiae]